MLRSHGRLEALYRGTTQVALAAALGMSQGNVSRIEHQDDVFLSTLREHVAALGGTLEVAAVFPDGGRVDLLVEGEPVARAG